MIIVIKLITFIIGSLLLINIIKSYFFKKNYNTIIYPAIVFYFFCYLPLLYDLLLGRPSYRSLFSGFIISYDNFVVELLYCIIIIYILIMFRSFQKRLFYDQKWIVNSFISNMIFIVGIIGLTLFVFPIISDPRATSVLLNYEIWYYRDEFFSEIKFNSTFVIFSALFLLLLEKNRKVFWMKLIMLIPFIYIGFLMNGKRNIVFMFGIGLMYIILNNKIVRKKLSYLFIFLLILISLFTFSSWYQNHFDRVEGNTIEESYTSYRVNFSRDNTMKMVIYSKLYDDNNEILDYPGQSILFYITAFIPREHWEEKPLPFAQYLTSYLLGYQEPRLNGWGMTNNIVDEMMSNFGIFIGSLISPIIIILICKAGMLCTRGILGNLILILSSFLSIVVLTVEITAYLILVYLFILLVFAYYFKNKFTLKL